MFLDLDNLIIVVGFTPRYMLHCRSFGADVVSQPSFERAYFCGEVKEDKFRGSKVECSCAG